MPKKTETETKTIRIEGYTRKSGVVVKPYTKTITLKGRANVPEGINSTGFNHKTTVRGRTRVPNWQES